MSKQSEAKAAQNYIVKASCCGDCRNLKSDLVLPAWMQKENLKHLANGGDAPKYLLESQGVEKNLRCGIGGFAVKKQAACCQHQPKETK